MQNPEYESLKLENQLCFPLYAVSRKIIGLYTPHLKPLGLTYTQYLVFLVLSERDEITVGKLCEILYLDNGTLSPLLKTMQKNGYLKRERSTSDERTVYISLTEQGRQMLGNLKDIPEKVGKCVPVSPEKAVLLYQALYEMLHELS
ncbi:MAG: MarR family transcriptional regulator [Oscillospiraceae bacterium]|nr:MarR family transcriptional regulator [Oscillospiraceae bacterium]